MTPEIREPTAADAGALQAFFMAMPPEDRTFFFWDVDDPEVARNWSENSHRRSRIALDEQGRILAFASLQTGTDWSRHVGELVLAVAPDQRRKGLGKALARTMLIEALHQGLRKVTVMIAADNSGAVEMFRDLGFEGEALLRDHLCSPEDGSLRDVILLAHLPDETWSSMLTGGIEGALR
jgi:L-amino acid N-acyltransferase YncA